MDPVTHVQSLFSGAIGGVGFVDVATDAQGDIYALTDSDTPPAALVKFDPVSGAQTVVSSGGGFVHPWSLAILSNGDILVADYGAAGGTVFRVNHTTGAQSIFESGLPGVLEIAVAPGDIVYVVASLPGPWWYIYRLDPAPTPVSPAFSDPRGIAVEATGTILVVESTYGQQALYRVNPANSSASPLATLDAGVAFGPQSLVDVAISDSGELWVVVGSYLHDRLQSDGAVVGVDPYSGAQAVLTLGGNLHLSEGGDVYRGQTTTPVHPEAWGRLKARYR
jgi:hypothetical protein